MSSDSAPVRGCLRKEHSSNFPSGEVQSRKQLGGLPQALPFATRAVSAANHVEAWVYATAASDGYDTVEICSARKSKRHFGFSDLRASPAAVESQLWRSLESGEAREDKRFHSSAFPRTFTSTSAERRVLPR